MPRTIAIVVGGVSGLGVAYALHRHPSHVIVEDEQGSRETFDDVVFACNATQTLMALDQPTFLEAWLLSSIR